MYRAQARTETTILWPPQIRTPRRLETERTKSKTYTHNMPVMPVDTASITADKPVAHGAVPRRIECCCTKIVCFSK